jgi:hypothetical protein
MASIAASCIAIPNSPIKLAMTAMMVTALMVSVSRFSVFYDKELDKLKDFGTAPTETIFPAWMAMLSVGWLVYVMTMATTAFEKCN